MGFNFLELLQTWPTLTPQTTKELIRKKNAFNLDSSRDKTLKDGLKKFKQRSRKEPGWEKFFVVAQQTSDIG